MRGHLSARVEVEGRGTATDASRYLHQQESECGLTMYNELSVCICNLGIGKALADL